jgi:hypothetical protein
MKKSRSHPGYIFLVSVLIIGAIGATTVVSLLLLGWAAQQNGYLVQQSQQAFEYGQTCVERSLRALRLDPSYGGNETVTFAQGSCVIHSVGGAGNGEHTLCVEGKSGKSSRRFELSILQLFPRVKIGSWQEVAAFSLCS